MREFSGDLLWPRIAGPPGQQVVRATKGNGVGSKSASASAFPSATWERGREAGGGTATSYERFSA
jgi:hypothetical protein